MKLLTAHTRVYGILGWPVEHSASPAMHNAAFEAAALDAVYVAFAVRPHALAAAVAGLQALGVRGFNVTLPHKQAVVALLDEVEPDALAIGAVNTVVRDGDRLIGTNTDGAGLVRSLDEAGVAVRGRRVTVLGAGGAARAAAVGLATAGAARITVAARRIERAEALLAGVKPAIRDVPCEACAIGDDLPACFAASDLLVQATSATLGSGPEASRFAASLPIDALPEGAAVVDLVYDPLTTTVLLAARERGLRTVDGMGMLLHQGAAAFERWTGVSAPIDAMRRALRAPAPHPPR